jgi:nanoRNase/pAp phosphatase (c-di-AMP/oligoRNAs hydrolase)
MDRLERTCEKLGKLKALWSGCRSLLIVMQDNPDPDAIAAAAALKELANKTAGISCRLSYGGTIGRAENRELVNYLGFNFYPFCQIDYSRFDLIALVDTQPVTGNNPLPADVLPDIVIDHHPFRKATRGAPFTDIRKNYGATSTILWEYLSAAKITPETPTATALLFGIRSDTQDLGREATGADIGAIVALYPVANKRMLGQIQHGRVPLSYYQLLTKALVNTIVYEHCLVCNIADVDNPDMIGEVADLLLRYEKVDWVMCFGCYNSRLLVSLRTQDKKLGACDVIHNIVLRIGTGGGHTTMAGGQIPLKTDKRSIQRRAYLERLMRERFLKTLKIKNKKGRVLVNTRTRKEPQK